MTNPAQESEAIRFGFDDVNDRSIRVLRELFVTQMNGHAFTDEQRARLIQIESEALALRRRRAVLDGRDPPERPAWMDPA